MTQEQRERVEKLVAALEGDQYEQGKRRLRDGSRYCCLGVACDLHRQATGTGVWDGDGRYYPYGYDADDPDQDDGDDLVMPRAVQRWYGFPEDNPFLTLDEQGVSRNAAEVNDSGTPFKEIAVFFRKKFLGENKA